MSRSKILIVLVSQPEREVAVPSNSAAMVGKRAIRRKLVEHTRPPTSVRMADYAGPISFNGADLLIRNEAQVQRPLSVQRAKSKIKNRDQPIPAIIVVAPNGKEMTADTSEGILSVSL